MNAWDKVVSFFSAKEEFKRTRFRAAADLVRKYEAASGGRRTKNWKASSSSANTEIGGSLGVLRDRSRQLVRDNPYATKGIQVITSNVVGWGVLSQVKVDPAQSNTSGQNKQASKREKELAALWRSWSESTAIDFDGRNNFAGIQRIVMRTIVEGGEVLIRRRRTTQRTVVGKDGIEVEVPPIQLQVLEGDFLDLTGAYGTDVPTGNTVLQGVEFDAQGRRVAYHLFEEHPGNSFPGMTSTLRSRFKTVRVLAEDVLHVFRMDRAGQIRGVPWLAPVMLRLKDFDEYEDAQLVRQKIAACFSVFVKDIDGVDAGLSADQQSELGEKVQPGIIEILPPGKDVTFASPPGVEGYGEYASSVLHAISAGLGVTYESLTGDYSQTNYSSGRMGFLDMSRNVEEWRENIIMSQFVNPVFGWFLNGASLLGYDTTRVRAQHTPPKREMVDPQKEVAAMKDGVRSGFMSLFEAIRQNGEDPEQVLDEIERSNQALDKRKLVLDVDPRNDAKRVATQPQPNQNQTQN